jgi:cytochrome P450
MRIVLGAPGADALIGTIIDMIAKRLKSGDDSDQPDPPTQQPASPSPDFSYLTDHFQEALGSFYATTDRIMADNPVDMAAFTTLAAKAGDGSLSADEAAQFATLKLVAQRQGRAVAAVLGFFLKYSPYSMLAEVRAREAVFQPPFGPVMVVAGDPVRDVLTRHHEFTVDPYGAEMRKSMSAEFNGGFDTFILSTDDDAKYIEDKLLLTSVVRAEDANRITGLVHDECRRRVKAAVKEAREAGHSRLDVVTTLARFVPVVLAHHYLGAPAAAERGSFELDDHMLKYYGEKVAGPNGKTPLPTSIQRPDGTRVNLPDSALARGDGVIPDEAMVYGWIVASFRHFFNNVQKDVEVQAHGVRAYRELLVYLLREIAIQRAALNENPGAVADTMLSRLLKIQMGLAPAAGIDPSRVSDLRIAENVMGTIVGAVAGQEEAICRVIDSMIRLQEGDFAVDPAVALQTGQRFGSFHAARELAVNVLEGRDVEANRAELYQYVFEALRLQPQGEVLLRICVNEGAVIAGSRPLSAGTLVFAAHGSAMRDVPAPDSFILGREESAYLQYGFGRHKCLGQYVSPVLMCEALIAILALENLRRPTPHPDEPAFPRERRFGRFQLDDDNLYAKTFTLEYNDSGNTHRYYSQEI